MEINDPFAMDDGLLKGIAPSVITHTEVKLKEEFAPWHKPRKQWIRDHQWGKMIGALIDSLELKKTGRPLDYLSLPGSDLLDIRSLEQVFLQKGVKLKFLGMNHIDSDDKEQTAEQNLSLNEVRALDFIEQESTVIPEQFEKISVETSIASDRVLRKHQSFDVINIDLCASFADKKPGGAVDNLYSAIYKLLKHQSFYRTEDWLFFITTRTDKKKVEFEALKKLIQLMLKKISHEVMQTHFGDKIGLNIEILKSDQFSAADLSTIQHRNCFTASLGIWKSDTLISGDSKTKSVMKEIYSYHVESTEAVADMVSMAFWCSKYPLVAEDDSGLSGAKININAPSPEEVNITQAKRAFERSINCIDLDCHLKDTHEDYILALERSKYLLKKARYSIDKYEPWVERQQERILGMINGQAQAGTG